MVEDEMMIQIENAGICHKGYSLKNVNLAIPKGYITGITGANGAGKTTLIKMILGRYPKMSGNIRIDGFDVIKQRDKMLAVTGYVSEERKFFMEQSAMGNEELYRNFYPSWDEKKYREQLKAMKVPAGTKLKDLSKGNYIKFQLAFALAANPKVIIMDEPTAGLDPVFRVDFLKQMQELIANEQITIVMSTNITDDLDKIADYVIGFANGSCYRTEADYEQ